MTVLLAVLLWSVVSKAAQTTVAHWEFSTGYDVEKSGSTAIYTPNSTPWSEIANTAWKTTQPQFRPNQCALVPEQCFVTVHTSDGKWQVRQSSDSYILRLNTASVDKFTATTDYADATKHDQYFEISLPTTALTNVKLNFAIGDGTSSSTKFGVIYSTDGGTTWNTLEDYVSGSHWNNYVDKTYSLEADNKASLVVRLLIQSATKTSNYNLKYVNILADDAQAPKLQSSTPANGASDVVTTGKVTLLFNETVQLVNNATATLTNNTTGASQSLMAVVNMNKVTFAYEGLDLTTSYTFSMPANSFADLSGNVLTESVSLSFTTSDSHPIPSPILDSKNRLWYHQPAQYWEEYMALGNGRLGAMTSGTVARDTLQLNEDTFWGQSPNRNHNPKAKNVLGQVQQMIFNGQYEEAQKLAIDNWMAEKSHGATYQAAGAVLVGFPGHRFNDEEAGSTVDATRDAQGYVRSLDMNNATAVTTYIQNGVTYKRTTFTSFADNVTIMHLEASEAGKLDFNVCYAAPRNNEKIGELKITEDGMIKGKLVPTKEQTEGIDNKLHCYTFVKVLNDGGTQTTSTQNIERLGLVASQTASPTINVKGATTATIIISSATNFVDYDNISDDASAEAKALKYLTDFLDKNKSFETALAGHTAKYQEQFNRVDIDLGHNTTQEQKDTYTRLKEFRSGSVNGNDPGLIANFFQFGRYLLISSSQPGTQPANLQGIWNPNARQYPAWDSKYTANINVQMNYWPAEVANLTECHEPFIQLIEDVSKTGAETAREMYGARGWTLHHNTDIWRTTGAVDNGPVGVWPTCNAWFCQHLWEKYLFSGDKVYLQKVYPIIKGAAQFYQDFLVKDPVSGYMVVVPSNSPENHPGIGKYTDSRGKEQKISLFQGVTMDNQMVYDLLKSASEAARTLGVDATDADAWDALKAQIAPYRIGQYGQVQEWQEDWDPKTSGHRHLSHLWGAYPGNQVSPYMNKTVFEGVRTALTARGDAARGWSIGWKICQWARMFDGEHALAIIKNQLRLLDSNVTIADPNGGTYINFFDGHAPFQIDGNFGACAGIAEMLIQSHGGCLQVLPALPSMWSNGYVNGLRARGGFEVKEMKWQNGKVVSLKIKSTLGGNLRLRAGNKLKMGNGAALVEAAGDNTNVLMQTYQMPDPIVKDTKVISNTTLPTTYVYDIPTTAGQEIELVDMASATGIKNLVNQDQRSFRSSVAYSMDGLRVSDSYKGLVIIDGCKYLRK